jgi:hypothetical protein
LWVTFHNSATGMDLWLLWNTFCWKVPFKHTSIICNCCQQYFIPQQKTGKTANKVLGKRQNASVA